MLVLLLTAAALGGAAMVARQIANSNPNAKLRQEAERLMSGDIAQGFGPVRLRRPQDAEYNMAAEISKISPRRPVYVVTVPGLTLNSPTNDQTIHLFTISGPFRQLRIYAAQEDNRARVNFVEVAELFSPLRSLRLHTIRKTITDALMEAERQRFREWMDQTQGESPEPWIMKHVQSWARSKLDGRAINGEINEFTHARRFFAQVGACGPVEPIRELERYLGHLTHSDIMDCEKIVTLGDVARAISFWGVDPRKR